MRVYLDPVEVMGGGARQTLFGVGSYFLSGYLATGLVWGYSAPGLGLNAIFLFVATFMHAVGLVYVPLAVWIFYQHLRGHYALPVLFVANLLVCLGAAYALEITLESWMLIGKLLVVTSLLAVLVVVVRRRNRRVSGYERG